MRGLPRHVRPRARRRPFLLVREPPVVTRAGDVWSVTLHARANQIYDGRIRAYRGSRCSSTSTSSAGRRELVLGPFLLGPGNYTLRLTGRRRLRARASLTWIVSARLLEARTRTCRSAGG